MKKLLLLSISSFLLSALQAQTGTDLEFNRIFNHCTKSSSTPSTIGTVPTGKIWKVVGCTANDLAGSRSIWLNNGTNDFYLTRWNGADNVESKASFPLYFNEGTALDLHSTCVDGCISVIEYTVVP